VSFINRRHLIAATGVLLVVILVTTLLGWHSTRIDSRLATPRQMLEGILDASPSAFVTPDFLPFVPKNRLAQIASRDETIEASRNPSLFLKLNRKKHFSTVLLGSQLSFLPLVNSLITSPLWVLSDISPWGYIFKPVGSSEWHPLSSQEYEKAWPVASDRTLWLIGTAARLVALGRTGDADQLLSLASTTHCHPSLLLGTRASIAATCGNWEEAKVLAAQAVEKDHSNTAARVIHTRALIECGAADKALLQARKLVSSNTTNEECLFLLARAANAANSSQEEIDALSRLVEEGKKNNQPLGASLVYLGQAFAKNGERAEALRTFQRAISSPELTEEQAHALREVMDHLMQDGSSSTNLPTLSSPDPSHR